jgi:hypothetical protein
MHEIGDNRGRLHPELGRWKGEMAICEIRHGTLESSWREKVQNTACRYYRSTTPKAPVIRKPPLPYWSSKQSIQPLLPAQSCILPNLLNKVNGSFRLC